MRPFILASVLTLSSLSPAWAELVVVANPAVKLASIRQADLARLFMGQASSLPDGTRAVAINVAGERREQFYQQVLGKSPAQMEKYWARMIFTGKAQPLREVAAKDLKGLLADTPGAIGYIDAAQVDGSLRVIRLER